MTIATMTATSLADLKGAAVGDPNVLFGRALWQWTAGDFTGLEDGVHIIKANSTSLGEGAWVRQSTASLLVNEGLDGTRPATGAYQQVVRLTQFGFKGDEVTDDTQAWRSAIAFAAANDIQRIVVPSGVSIVSGQIVDAENPLPPGLTFAGEATRDNPYRLQSVLRYTGTSACWSVTYETESSATTGNWAFEDMTFQCSDPAGTMFDFNDTAGQSPNDDPDGNDYEILAGIRFTSCNAFGANGTGDFLRAYKTFEINVDATSSVYGFRRAFWLMACDNNEIACRMAGNNRAVMIEPAGFYGNNNRINVHYVGGTSASFGGEDCYAIYDKGNKTVIGNGFLLEGIGATAHLYLGGYGTEIHSPLLGEGSPFFELADTAREVVLYSPRCTVIDPVNTPIIAAPLDPNFGNSAADFRMRIYDAPQSIQAIIPDHPRIVMPGRLRTSTRNAPDPLQPLFLSDTGPQSLGHICTAYNYWGTPDSPGGGGIKAFVQDSSLDDRWVMHLNTDTAEQGIALKFIVGDDIQPGMYRLVNRMRLSSGSSNAGWALIVKYNGGFFSNAFTFATGSSHTTHSDLLDLTGAARGSEVSINLYNADSGATEADLFVEALGLIPVLDAGWTAGTGTANKNGFAAYGGQTVSSIYAEAEAQAVANAARDASQRVLALEQALRRHAIIN